MAKGWNYQKVLKCLATEVFNIPHFNIPHESILTSPTHPKYSRSVYFYRGACKNLDALPSTTQEAFGTGMQQFSSLAEHLAVLAWHCAFFYSLQFIHHIFSNFRNKRSRCTTDNSLIAALMCPQYTICPVQRREWKALCNRYLKPIVQCTQNNHATNHAELSSPVQ